MTYSTPLCTHEPFTIFLTIFLNNGCAHPSTRYIVTAKKNLMKMRTYNNVTVTITMRAQAQGRAHQPTTEHI